MNIPELLQYKVVSQIRLQDMSRFISDFQGFWHQQKKYGCQTYMTAILWMHHHGAVAVQSCIPPILWLSLLPSPTFLGLPITTIDPWKPSLTHLNNMKAPQGDHISRVSNIILRTDGSCNWYKHNVIVPPVNCCSKNTLSTATDTPMLLKCKITRHRCEFAGKLRAVILL